ncbi:Ribosome biogenesis protein BMS1 homolog (Ribosome assembly protein BMS1 homolog) [Durusdinium trenchii]|uniref:Ribosome biogenesis protein BMS1 homolog (Ribosome assembly protein BMS1 homolog) n=1 Tax=Durusdinium trenchii TaxID=1381693 RepID=A0ABP0K703_9DINO
MESGEKPKKTHKKRAAGQKAKKKKTKQLGKVEKHNPKAHTFSGGKRSVQRRVQYTLERQAKKDKAPKVDKTPEVPPPFIVVVQGPPGVGKTTLIQSLVKHYAKQRLIAMGGPVTLVSGRHRRLTIIECPQAMSAMLDLAKIADLVLLLIDASYGFELETFEFINILQVHGFPRVIGVLTHLDSFKENKQLRKVKKSMKHRFWAELYDGAKLFYLSGLQYGRYHRLEIQNLARFIAVQKAPLLSWRQSHPYVLALRWEDQTDPTLPEASARRLDLYGYVYGGRLREGIEVHLPGVGDFNIAGIKKLTDPCPPPQETEAERRRAQARKGDEKPKKNALRTLAERHRVVYAPGSEIGSITVDSEAMYIYVPDQQAGFTPGQEKEPSELPEAVRLVRALQESEGSLDKVSEKPNLRLVGNTTVRPTGNHERRPAPEVAEQDEKEAEGDEVDEGEEEEAAEEDVEERDEEMLSAAARRFARAPKLEEMVYGSGTEQFGGSSGSRAQPENLGTATDHHTVPLFEDEDNEEAEARPGEKSSALLGNLGDLDGLDSARMPKLPGEELAWDESRKEALKARKFITGGWSSAEEEEEDEEKEEKAPAEDGEAAEENPEAKEDAVQTIPDVFLDGFPIGCFVRVRLEDVPAACVAELRREKPIILGGLLAGESRMGLVQTRIKRHRWHPKLLKSSDALLLSVGWRRFQTLPVFSLEDRGEKRMRYLKYTLEHAHCTMTCYGPMVPPNTGVLAFRSWEKVGHFRVCGTGVVLEAAPNFEVKKKLKLVGEPYKIFRNTAFIKNMFSSDLEVNKYMHAKIQTVSGIRGEIKKAEGVKGQFRASFEDRILMSDLVVCKCWITVPFKEFYHPVLDVPNWRPARLIGELRAAQGVPVPDNPDSRYGKQLVRPERRFNPLKVPKSLQASLPFSAKQKLAPKKQKTALTRKAAIVSSEREKAVNNLIQRLYTIRKEKARVRQQASDRKRKVKEVQDRFIQEKRDAHMKEAKKNRHVKEGQKDAKRRKAMMMD